MYDGDMDRKIFMRYAVRELMGVATVVAALFIPAATWQWWQAWAAVILTLAWVIATAWAILRAHPALLAERLGPRGDSQRWDIFILSTMGLLQLLRYVLAGLDHRMGWTTTFPQVLQIAGLLLAALGSALAVWATGSNAFFSQVVRLQADRGQRVVDSGPYAWVRHPAYFGLLLVDLSLPLLLNSLPALGIGLLEAVLLIVRTRLEDDLLRADLDGYAEYAQRVRTRLLPGIW
jgi:protein-S-isoprenylcysteine O-methyltransferase Ste14